MLTRQARTLSHRQGRCDQQHCTRKALLKWTTGNGRPSYIIKEGTTDSHDWRGKYHRYKSLRKARPVELVKESTTILSNQGKHDPSNITKVGTIPKILARKGRLAYCARRRHNPCNCQGRHDRNIPSKASTIRLHMWLREARCEEPRGHAHRQQIFDRELIISQSVQHVELLSFPARTTVPRDSL